MNVKDMSDAQLIKFYSEANDRYDDAAEKADKLRDALNDAEDTEQHYSEVAEFAFAELEERGIDLG